MIEDEQEPLDEKGEEEKESGARPKRLTSPQAERAKNILAERARQQNDTEGNDESHELPESEHIDFLSTYDSNHFWQAKDADGNPVEEGSEFDFPTLDELIVEENRFFNYSETTSLKQRFTDL